MSFFPTLRASRKQLQRTCARPSRRGRRVRRLRCLELLETRALLSADDSLLAVAPALTAQPLSASSMVVRTRDSYLPGVALLVQIELLGADGKPLRELW